LNQLANYLPKETPFVEIGGLVDSVVRLAVVA